MILHKAKIPVETFRGTSLRNHLLIQQHHLMIIFLIQGLNFCRRY